MRTKIGARSSVVAALLGAAAALPACSSTPGVDGARSEGAAGKAPRDVAALGAMKTNPVKCGRDAACPTGSRCDEATGTCTWECLAASDCGPHATCTQDGRCVSIDGAEGLALAERANGAARAPKVFAGLGESCTYTDECPDSAYCDQGSHTCVAGCASDAACASGSVCVHGACEAAPKSLPRIAPSSAVVQVATIAAGATPTDLAHAQPVQLVATSANAALAGTTAKLGVTVTASEGVLVACADGASGLPAGGFASSCVIDGWTFAATTSGARATKTVWIAATSLPVDDPTSASLAVPAVTVAAAGATISSSRIAVRLPPGARAPADPLGEYVGQVVLDGSGVAAANGHAAVDDQRIDVTAVRTPTGILIFDETRQISRSGTLFYPTTSNRGYVDALLAPPSKNVFITSDTSGSTGVVGDLVVPDTAFGLAYDGATLTGRLNFGNLRKARFVLKRSGDSKHAACTTSCGTGQVCDTHAFVCVPAADQWTAAESGANTLKNTRFQAWWDAAGTVLKAKAGSASLTAGGNAVAERTLCYRAGNDTIDHAPLLGDAVLPVSGELECADGSVTGTVPVFTYADGAAGTSASAMYQACLAELSKDAPAGAGVADVFTSGDKCVSLGRLAAGMQVAKTNDPRLYIDLVRQWVELHAFLAQQGRTQWQEANVLAAAATATGDQQAAGSPQALFALLEHLERGWDVLLTQNVVGGLVAVPRDQQGNPDFRTVGHNPGNAVSPSHEQGLGLPVTLMDAMTDYLAVLETLLDQAGGEVYGWCLSGTSPSERDTLQERVGTTLRYAMSVEDYTLILRRSLGTAVQPDWLARYDAAHADYLAVRQRVSRKANDLFECKNPLGVSDDALPLYFVDPTTVNQRYFAAVDYMMSTVVPGAMAPMKDAYSNAQSAWQSVRSADLQDQTNAATFDQRLDDLITSLSKPINDACGGGFDVTPYFEGKTTTPPDFTTCYLDTSRPECTQSSRDATCYHGTLGEAALEIVAANQDVQIAASTARDDMDAYAKQYDYCVNLSAKLKKDDELTQAHLQTMQQMRHVKQLLDDVAAAADAAGKCAGGASSSFGAVCGPAAVEGMARVLSNGIGDAMETEQENHQAEMEKRQHDQDVVACFHEGDMRHEGIEAANLTIDRRRTDLQMAILKLTNLQAQVGGDVVQGVASIARDKGRKLPSLADRRWLDDAAREYFVDLLDAKRATYLALQAAEYALQQTFAVRADIVTARTPDQLQTVLTSINKYLGTRTVEGARPGVNYRVLSLRDEILGLTGKLSTADTGYQSYDPYEDNYRLRDRLRDPAAAIYGKDGRYLGQGVYFTLSAPDHFARAAAGTDGLPADWNFPAADTTCAERLWSISATIGGADVATEPSGTLQIFKRNTFYSQWCDSTPRPTPFQVGKYLPTGYLYGVDPTAPRNNDETQEFLSANLIAPFQMTRTEMEKTPPTPAQDLAGRGLFGDYLLVFPASLLADPKFNMDSVEDVLLRFDFDDIARNGL